MKIKTIKKVIEQKFDDFVKTINDPEVKNLVERNTIITGGCIASLLLKEKVNDFDLYFRTAETAFKVAKHFMSQSGVPHLVCGGGFTGDKEIDHDSYDPAEVPVLESYLLDKERIRIFIRSKGVAGEMPEAEEDGVEETESPCGKPEKDYYQFQFASMNAITLTGKIQLVTRFYGEPQQIHDNYDFIHCKNYWTSWDRQLVTNKEALEALMTKELRYVGSKYPLCSIFRTKKFINRGWTINAGQYLKMVMQLGEMDLNNVRVLADQLIGVDAHYFNQVIEALALKQGHVENSYLFEIIDRVFG